MTMIVKTQLPAKQTKFIIWSLLYLMPIIGMAVDLIAPSLPTITKELAISEGVGKNIITCFLIGYPIGNFLTGFLTDAYGRKKMIRLNLIAFILTSLLPVIYPNIATLLVTRLLQGITLGSSAVLLRAIIADILPAEKIIKLGAVIGAMWGLGPVFGPWIGGYLQLYYGWKACFLFFALITLPGFITIFMLVPETHTNPHPLNLHTIKANCHEVLSHKMFVGLPIIMGVAYSLIIAFHTSGPFLIQNHLHYSALFFGRLALILGVCFLVATFVCRYLLNRYQVQKLLKLTTLWLLVIITIAVASSYIFGNNIYQIIIPSSLVFFATGILYPAAMGKGLSLFGHIAGTATAIMYLINGIIVSLTSYLMSYFNVSNSSTLMWIYLFLIIICNIVFRLFIADNKHASGNQQ